MRGRISFILHRFTLRYAFLHYDRMQGASRLQLQRNGIARHAARSYSGILPCFFKGVSMLRFRASISKLRAMRSRVSCGSITSLT